jgi:hypothetical protein
MPLRSRLSLPNLLQPARLPRETTGRRPPRFSRTGIPVVLGLMAAVAVPAVPAFSQSLSFSTDFDGSGTGGSISISSYSSSSGNSYHPHYYRPQSSSGNSYAAYYAYEYQRYLQQQQEAEKRRELMERIAEEKRINNLQRLQSLLGELDQLEGADVYHQYQLKYQVINELVPQFNAEQQQAVRDRNSVLERLTYQMDHTHVPPPPGPRHYGRVFIGGLFYTQGNAARDKSLGLNDPFTGKAFDETLGFGSNSAVDLARVTADHFLSELNRLSENMLGGSAATQLQKLKGATIDELVCHSNGCAIAQVLIATGFVKVGTLRMLGGDAAIMDLDALHALHEKTGVTVAVYAVVGDPVPLVPTGWQIVAAMKKIGKPLVSFQNSQSLTDEALGLKARSGFTPDAPIRVQLLTAPVSGEPWMQEHARDTYFGIVTAQRMMGVRLPDGNLNPAAMNR